MLDAAGHAEPLRRKNQHTAFALGADGRLRAVAPGHPDAAIAWRPDTAFELVLPPDDPRHALIDLYLPICGATDAHPITVGHLGQSLDGFIATHSGESQFATGEENILHLHRMRALCDAVVVGAGTVAADDPQLTTRYVWLRACCASSSIRRGGWRNITKCSTTARLSRCMSARSR